jgi:hypothetical protein
MTCFLQEFWHRWPAALCDRKVHEACVASGCTLEVQRHHLLVSHKGKNLTELLFPFQNDSTARKVLAVLKRCILAKSIGGVNVHH